MRDTLSNIFILLLFTFMITGCYDDLIITDSRFTIEFSNIPKHSVRELSFDGIGGWQYLVNDSIYITITTFNNSCLMAKSDFSFLLTDKIQECNTPEEEVFFGLGSEFIDEIYVEKRVKVIRNRDRQTKVDNYRYEYWMKCCNKERTINIVGYEKFGIYNLEKVLNWTRKFDDIKIEISN